uniref:Protein lin-10 n=1 Tax=Rhabditophanes sp. KR3021 TaxID=114890 RepID=A0AC35TTX6_9BILA
MTAAPDFDGLHKTHHHEQDSERPQMSSPHSESSPSKSSMSSGSTNEEVAQASQSFLASIQSNHPPPNLSDYSPDKFQEVMNNYMQTIMSAAANRFQQDPNSAALFLTQQNSMLQASSLNSLSSPSKISTSTPTSIESGSVSSSPMPLIMCNANDADKMLNQVEEISQANVELSTDSSSSTLMDIQKDLNARVDQDVEEYSSFECNVKEMTLTEVPVVAEKMSKVETQTNDLIKKQMNEIEKEITRRSQNKNVRKLAAAILSQLQSNPSLLENIAASSGTTNLGQTSATTQQPKVMGGPPTNLMKIPPPPTISVPQPRANFCNSGSSSSSTNKTTSRFRNENGWESETKNNNHHQTISEDKENGDGPGEDGIWVMRDSYQKKCQADIEEEPTQQDDEDIETDKLLSKDSPLHLPNITANGGSHLQPRKPSNHNKKEVLIHEPAVLIEGVLFRAKYLGSTQLICDGRPSKSSRMSQAQEAVARVKAPEGEIQPSTEIDLFISTEKIMVLNTDLQRISDTDVRQDILMDHALRTISYIADIGDLVVLMARRMSNSPSLEDPGSGCAIKKAPRVVCHVFESDEAAFIAQSIGQAFKVAYVEFLRANGIEDPDYLRESDYQEVLNSQELLGEELEMFARKETQKDVIVPKKVGECLGIVVVESGWGSMLPTVVVANLAPGGAAARSNNLNIGDQIIAINGISLVGLPLVSAQSNIKKAKTSTAVRLTVVSTPPVVEVRIKRPDKKFQLGFSVQNGVICSLLRGGIAERGGIRVGHRIIEINHKSVVAVAHEIIVNLLATATGEIHMKTMPTSMFRLLTGQEAPNYI